MINSKDIENLLEKLEKRYRRYCYDYWCGAHGGNEHVQGVSRVRIEEVLFVMEELNSGIYSDFKDYERIMTVGEEACKFKQKETI